MKVGRLLLLSLAVLAATSCSTAPVATPALTVPAHVPQEIWEVSPAQGYTDLYGYVRLEYLPPVPGPGRPGENPPPAGGRLVVHLGRLNLDHANTAWYNFRVTEGSTELLQVGGKEGIPNVKGPDGNWWDDIDLDLQQPIRGPIAVTVDDGRIGEIYTFFVRRKASPQG